MTAETFYPTFRRSILAEISFTRGIGVDRASTFSHNARVEGLAEVLSVTKQPIIEVAEGVEAGGSYAIEAKICAPADKYSNGFFRVKISKPADLAGKVPSLVNHGRFTFDSERELKAGDTLEISISPA
jgi:hypothetical protein